MYSNHTLGGRIWIIPAFCVPNGYGNGVFWSHLSDRSDHSDERCLRTRTFPCRSDSAVPAAPPAPAEDRQALAAAIAAAVAEDLGTDITGIRILSLKKL